MCLFTHFYGTKNIYYLYFTPNIESNEISTSDKELNNDLTQKNIKNTENLLTIFQIICYLAGLHSVFPTLFMAICIAYKLSVCYVTCITTKITFSKLKVIKYQLRSTI